MQRLKQLLRENVLLIGILLLGIFLRWHYFYGIDFDGTGYTLAAKSITERIYDPTYLNGWNQGIRFGMILPIALMYKLFGVSDFTTFFFQFAISVLQIVLIYYLGKMWFDEKTALVAAFLLAIFPIDVNNASILEADISISFLSGLIVLLFYRGDKENKLWMLVIAGILYGIALFTKIFAGLLISFYFLYSLFFITWWRKILKNTLWISVGAFLVIIATMLYFYNSVHDPFYFYTVEKRVNDSLLGTGILDLWYYPSQMLLLHQYADPPMYSIYFLLFFVAVGYFVKNRKKETSLLLFWVLPILILLMFIPTLPKVQRYLIVVELPVILLISAFLWKKYTSIASLWIKNFFCTITLCAILFTIIPQYGAYKDKISDQIDITHIENIYYIALKDAPRRDIYLTHYNQVPFLSYYFHYEFNSSLPFSYRGAANYSFYDLHFFDSEEIHDAYVIFDPEFLKTRKNATLSEELLSYYKINDGSLEQWPSTTISENWYELGSFQTKHGKSMIFYVK